MGNVVALLAAALLATSPQVPRVLRGPSPPMPVQAQWPMYGGNPRHTGHTSFVGPAVALPKWSTTVGTYLAAVLAGPVIGPNGTVYVGPSMSDEHLIALEAASGKELWRFNLGSNAVSTTPLVTLDGTIVRVHAVQWSVRGA
jgi:outer membrane protein assembly factor BamB